MVLRLYLYLTFTNILQEVYENSQGRFWSFQGVPVSPFIFFQVIRLAYLSFPRALKHL